MLNMPRVCPGSKGGDTVVRGETEGKEGRRGEAGERGGKERTRERKWRGKGGGSEGEGSGEGGERGMKREDAVSVRLTVHGQGRRTLETDRGR
jgi:hypothetical protein